MFLSCIKRNGGITSMRSQPTSESWHTVETDCIHGLGSKPTDLITIAVRVAICKLYRNNLSWHRRRCSSIRSDEKSAVQLKSVCYATSRFLFYLWLLHLTFPQIKISIQDCLQQNAF